MNFLKAFLIALVGSVAVNVIIVSFVGPMVLTPGQHLTALTLMPVVMFTVIGTIGATIVYAIIRALMAQPQKPFIWLSVVVLIASFYPDYMIIGATNGPFSGGTLPEALVLMFMHVVAAVIIVWALVKVWGAKAPKVAAAPTPVSAPSV
jgi:hypothetical protein